MQGDMAYVCYEWTDIGLPIGSNKRKEGIYLHNTYDHVAGRRTCFANPPVFVPNPCLSFARSSVPVEIVVGRNLLLRTMMGMIAT